MAGAVTTLSDSTFDETVASDGAPVLVEGAPLGPLTGCLALSPQLQPLFEVASQHLRALDSLNSRCRRRNPAARSGEFEIAQL